MYCAIIIGTHAVAPRQTYNHYLNEVSSTVGCIDHTFFSSRLPLESLFNFVYVLHNPIKYQVPSNSTAMTAEAAVAM